MREMHGIVSHNSSEYLHQDCHYNKFCMAPAIQNLL